MDENHSEVSALYARILQQDGDYDRALFYARKAAASVPNAINHLNTVAQIQYENQEWTEALRLLRQTRQLSQDRSEYSTFYLARIHRELGKFGEARTFICHTIDINPKIMSYWCVCVCTRCVCTCAPVHLCDAVILACVYTLLYSVCAPVRALV